MANRSGLRHGLRSDRPNPTSGYVLMVRPEELREIDISVDDALKFHVSLGVVTPTARSHRSVLTSESPGPAG